MITKYNFHFIDLSLNVKEVDDNYLEITGIKNAPYHMVWRAIDLLCRTKYNSTILDKNVSFYSDMILVNLSR